MVHTAKRVANTALTIATYLVLLVLIVALIAGLFGFRAYAIRSGSMVPTLPVGSLVIDRDTPPIDLSPGDIVTFKDPQLGEQLVTHRIVQMIHVDNTMDVVTRGDANLSTEQWSAPLSTKLGRVVDDIPQFGRFLLDSETPDARVVEVVLAFLWIAYLVLRWLWKPAVDPTIPHATP